MFYNGGFPEYVSVAKRQAAAARHVARLHKKGIKTSPIERITGRAIAKTFWGQAWCENLEAYDQLSARIERGRTYVRNGSVIDLQISKGRVTSLVSGTQIYEVVVVIDSLESKRWKRLVGECAGKIDSMVELLTGKISAGVMEILCGRATGVFPGPQHISMKCSCPDGSWLCKHLAATLYGVGARLDHEPELLFVLRGVDTMDLLGTAGAAQLGTGTATNVLQSEGLADIFDIELDAEQKNPVSSKAKRAKRAAPKRRARR